MADMQIIDEQLTELEGTKLAIKDALIEQGQYISANSTFREYAGKILNIDNSSLPAIEVNEGDMVTIDWTVIQDALYNAIDDGDMDNIEVRVDGSDDGYDTFLFASNGIYSLGLRIGMNEPCIALYRNNGSKQWHVGEFIQDLAVISLASGEMPSTNHISYRELLTSYMYYFEDTTFVWTLNNISPITFTNRNIYLRGIEFVTTNDFLEIRVGQEFISVAQPSLNTINMHSGDTVTISFAPVYNALNSVMSPEDRERYVPTDECAAGVCCSAYLTSGEYNALGLRLDAQNGAIFISLYDIQSGNFHYLEDLAEVNAPSGIFPPASTVTGNQLLTILNSVEDVTFTVNPHATIANTFTFTDRNIQLQLFEGQIAGEVITRSVIPLEEFIEVE